jgi:DnaK suppressor protein
MVKKPTKSAKPAKAKTVKKAVKKAVKVPKYVPSMKRSKMPEKQLPIKISFKQPSMPARRAGRPAKPKSAKNAKPLSPSPIIKTKIIPLKSPTLIITRTQTAPSPVNEKPLSNSEVSKYRDILQTKREDLVQLVARKKEMEFQEVEPEIGDEADIATASVEKDILYEMTDVEQQNLDSVEAALRKIEKGVFGKCEVCGNQIPRQRLEVMPWARNCVFCQTKNELPSAAPITPAQAE